MDAQRTDRRTVAHTKLTPAQRSARAKLAAHARWSRQSGSEGTQAAREGFLARFTDQVDPEGQLDPRERARRAESAMRAHMQGLAFRRHRSTPAAAAS